MLLISKISEADSAKCKEKGLCGSVRQAVLFKILSSYCIFKEISIAYCLTKRFKMRLAVLFKILSSYCIFKEISIAYCLTKGFKMPVPSCGKGIFFWICHSKKASLIYIAKCFPTQ